MAQGERGLYETLVTEAMEEQLAGLDGRLRARRSELHEAEAADRIALHLARVIERAIDKLDKRERVKVGEHQGRRAHALGRQGRGATAPCAIEA